MFLSKKKNDVFLVIDIGTEAIKAVICQENGKEKTSKDKEENRMIIKNASLQYFEEVNFNDFKFQEKIIKKTLKNTLKKLFYFLSIKNYKTIVSLPPTVLKARVINIKLSKKENSFFKNNKEFEEYLFYQAREKISDNFAKETGILPSEIEWLKLKIIQRKVNGYPVSSFDNFEKIEAEALIVGIFALRDYLEMFKRIFKDLKLKEVEIFHLVEFLSFIIDNQDKEEAILFLDIGGTFSQYFFFKDNILENIGEINIGGKIFSQYLADDLGIDETTARCLKENYNKNLNFSVNGKVKIEKILNKPLEEFISFFQEKMSKKFFNNKKIIFSVNIFGGGSSLPGIKEAVKKIFSVKNDLFFHIPQVKTIKGEDYFLIKTSLKNNSKIGVFSNPQYFPCLLMLTKGLPFLK